MVNKLNERQKRFADEYLIDLNAEAAAIRAGYSPRYARGNAHKLVAKGCIKDYIAERMEEREKRTEITQDRVLLELSYIAFSKATDYANVVEKPLKDEEGNQLYDSNGDPVMFRTVEPVLTENLTEEQKRAIAVIKKGRDGFEIKPYDKQRALELIGKHLGMFTDTVELKGNVNNPMEGLTTEELKKLIGDG